VSWGLLNERPAPAGNLRARSARPARSMRPIRGASNHPIRSPHYQCAFATRPGPGIHGSTTSTARS